MATSGGGCTVWPHLEEGVQYGHIRRRVYTVWPHLEEGVHSMATSGGGCTVWPHLEEGTQYMATSGGQTEMHNKV